MDSSQSIDWTIYKLTNPLGQVYIGRTRIPKKRFLLHFNPKTQKNRLIKKSFMEYGVDSHKIETIDTFVGTEDFSNGKEIFWIRTFMSNVGKWPHVNGFNLNDGGNGNLGWVQTKETIEKRAKSLTGIKRSPEYNKAMSDRMMGVRQPKQKAINIGLGHQKPMVIYDLNGNFIKEVPSGRHVYFFLYGKWGTCGHIYEVAKGKRANYKGFIFKYKKDV